MAISSHHAKLEEASLHPPAALLRSPEDDNDTAASIPWVLLDLAAYVADHRNDTTAFSRTESGTEIQVTFFLARPPRVSYFCVFCPGKDHTAIPMEPKILAMDNDLVLLHIVVGPNDDTVYPDYDLFIYHANGGAPSLERLPRPPSKRFFDYRKTGLLRCRDGAGGRFIIAELCDLFEPGIAVALPVDTFKPGLESGHKRFAMYVYDSKPQAWTVSLVSLDQQQQQKQPGECFLHFNSNVIAVGGESGTMGFVDLWRGILLCDVVKGDPDLRYVPLPEPIRPGRDTRSDPRLHRDIAVVQDCIKFVELQVKWTTGTWGGRYHSDGWMARTFSRPMAAAVNSSVVVADDDWRMDCEIMSSDEIDVDDGDRHLEVLPRPLDDEGRPMAPFKSVVICQPTLSLSNDDGDTVHFMNKDVPGDDKAWVIAVDMKEKKVLGAAKFAAERTDVVTFAYVHTRISEYLTGTSGSKGSHKRHGRMLVQSSS